MEVNLNADNNVALSNRERKRAVLAVWQRLWLNGQSNNTKNDSICLAQYTLCSSIRRNNGLGERANSPTTISFSIQYKTKTITTLETENDHIYMRCLHARH